MANQKISELAEKAYLQSPDLFAVVEDPTGSPVTKKMAGHKVASGLWTAPTADFGLTNALGVQAAFPAASDTLTVEALTSYYFEALYYMTNGTTTHTTATAFAGTATMTAFHYMATIWSAADLAIATAVSVKMNNGVGSQVLNATSIAASTVIRLCGLMRVNAAGTLIPQINFSAAPGGTNLMKVGSWFRAIPAGSNTLGFLGPWA